MVTKYNFLILSSIKTPASQYFITLLLFRKLVKEISFSVHQKPLLSNFVCMKVIIIQFPFVCGEPNSTLDQQGLSHACFLWVLGC